MEVSARPRPSSMDRPHEPNRSLNRAPDVRAKREFAPPNQQTRRCDGCDAAGKLTGWRNPTPRRSSATMARRPTWEAGDNGVMCFDATWRTVPSKPEEASYPAAKSCFEHQGRRRAIAQRKLPDGIWYFFEHSKPNKTDEVFKLRRGDHTGLAS
jgi:hypothetical protein